MTDSRTLLAEYRANRSELAFRELVARYVDLVYSAAVRLVSEERHLAEDVAQMVFADLARLARSLPKEVMLGGWLHRHTCFVARTLLRRERRRRDRERQAVEMNALQDHSEANFALVAPVLDEAVSQLGATDRAAILLRFFEQRDFRAVGEALGSNEDAARMRVNRALEKLHSLLKRRGVTLSATALGTALAGQAVAAPAGLAAGISSAVLAGTATGAATTFTALKLILMAKLKLGIVSAVLVASVVTPLVLQQQARARIRGQEDLLRQQQTQLAALQSEQDRLTRLAGSPAPSGNQAEELQRLRAEAASLQQQTSAVVKLREENRQLKAAAPQQTELQAMEGVMATMSSGKQWVMGMLLYSTEHQDTAPTELEQAKAALDAKTRAAIETSAEQFEIVYQGKWSLIKQPAKTVVLRAKQARQMPNGKWAKVYGFADGHLELHYEADGNFKPWEQEHILAAAAPNQ